jgi:trimeric autotransporter adhesin
VKLHLAQAVLPVLFLYSWAAAAQDGSVRASGQPIPGAQVTAVQGTQKVSTVTDEDGRYHFDKLAPGDWDFTVEMFGFAKMTQKLSVNAIASLPFDWELKLESKTAAAAPARGPGQGGGRGGGRGANAGFQNLTLNNQQPDAELAPPPIVESAPGAAGDNANEAFLVNGSLSQGISQGAAQGGREGIPGGFNPNFGGGGAGAGFPGGDGSTPSLAGLGGGAGGAGGAGGGGRGGGGFPGGGGGFPGGGGGRGGGGGGRGGGGRGQRGGPDGARQFGNRARRQQGIHGSAYLTVGNSAVNALPYSLTGQEIAQPAYGSARFGFSAGGPLAFPKFIHSDKTFFFINYTGQATRQPYTNFATLPSAAQRAGNFEGTDSTTGQVMIFDPTTHNPFPGNVIPTSRIDPAALKLLSLFPLPNQPGTVQNYDISKSIPNNNENINVRMNRPITPKDQANFNINYQERNNHTAQLFGYEDPITGYGLSTSVGWVHTLGKSTTNSTTITFSRTRAQTVSYFADGQDYAALFGINGTSTNPINFGPPNLSFTNYGGLSDSNASLTRNQTAGINDGMLLVRGRHTITFGGEFRRQDLSLKTDTNGRGSFTFSGLLTSQLDAKGQAVPGTGYDFADFLLGLPQSSNIGFGDTSNYFQANVIDAYVGDDFRWKSGLTINASLRYEYFTPYSEKYGHISNLDIAPGFTGVAVVTPGGTGPYSGKFPDALVNSDPKAFSPRLGIAYKPWKKRATLIRTGYGIFFNGSIYSTFPFRLSSQPPFATSANLVTSTADPLTIENGFADKAVAAITNTYAVDKNYRIGYIQTWNFQVQQTLPHQLVMELGYLGTKGTRLDIQEYPNRAAVGSSQLGSGLQIANATSFVYDTWNGNSIYHAAQARFTRRFAKGISANLLYTFSKSIDDASSISGGATIYAQNANDLSAERGLSAFDHRHVLTGSFVLTSPVGEQGYLRGRGFVETLLKDWTLNGTLTAQSGAPLTARVLGNESNIAGTGAIGSGRAEATGLAIDSGSGPFNLLAFTTPAPGTLGNAGRDTIPGPSSFVVNFSFGRSFKVIDERKRVEIRVDSTNTLNQVNLSGFYTTVNATNYGLPSSVSNMRSITATLRLRY